MPRPVLIVPIPEEKLVRLLWDDDELHDYPYGYLRGWCPCAGCQGHGGERRFVAVEDPELVGVGPVGNYAISAHWSDGHDTGIYTFEYLRQLSEQRRVESGSAARG